MVSTAKIVAWGCIAAAFMVPEKAVEGAISKWNGEALSILLLIIAGAITVFAVRPGNTPAKAILLGWLVMP